MKKILSIIILLFTSMILVSCNVFNKEDVKKVPDNTSVPSQIDTSKFQNPKIDKTDNNTIKITLVLNNTAKEEKDIFIVKDKIARIQIPYPKADNSVFLGWYKDPELQNMIDLNTTILDSSYNNTKLYARWLIDYKKLINDISIKYIRANVKITATFTVDSVFYEQKIGASQGSGIIFLEDNFSYYVLTNNHVVTFVDEKKIKYTNISVHPKITDYRGQSYNAQLIASDPNYDLALIRFTKSVDLEVLKLSKNDPKISQDVIAIGQPKGQNNSVTFGNIEKYKKATLADAPSFVSDVKFDVAIHDAPIDRGSSGGALLDINYEIVGINYAGHEDNFSTTNSHHSLAIPISKVREFLSKYINLNSI